MGVSDDGGVAVGVGRCRPLEVDQGVFLAGNFESQVQGVRNEAASRWKSDDGQPGIVRPESP